MTVGVGLTVTRSVTIRCCGPEPMVAATSSGLDNTRTATRTARLGPWTCIWWTGPTNCSASTSASPRAGQTNGQEIGAVRGVLLSLLGMIADGATHVGVATDHVVESFRNDLWPGYKTGEGIEPELRSQFGILETALEALGLVVWPMAELEADDALASAAP